MKNITCTVYVKNINLVATPRPSLTGVIFNILTLKQLFVYLTGYGTYLPLWVERSVGIIINLLTILSLLVRLHKMTIVSNNVYKLLELNSTIFSDVLEDYPDSPVNTSTMDTRNFPSGAAASGERGNPSGSCSTQTIRGSGR